MFQLKKNVLFFLTLALCTVLVAQQPNLYKHLEVKSINRINLLPSFISFSAGSTNIPAEGKLNDWFRKNLKANAEFNLVSISSANDKAGFKHIKYRQFYNNLPVEGSMVNTHFLNGTVQSLNGSYYPNLVVNTNPALGENAALEIALAKYGDVEFAWENKVEEAFLKQIENNFLSTYYPKGELVIISPGHSQIQNEFRLAYKFNVYVFEPLSREMIYIDAITGDILYTEQLIHTTDVKGTGLTRYSGMQSFMCDSLAPDSFILRESGRGNGIQTYNAVELTKLDTSMLFRSASSYWDLKNAKKDEVALDIHWGLERSYDFYKEVLGINSINDSGFKLIGLVHVKKDYNNANWNGKFVSFGDGDGKSYKPFTSIDICGHEVTHGLTQKSANLIYKDESGGLNESFSDIFGKCIEHYSSPDSFSWLVGKTIQFNGNYLRSMKEPNLKQNPKYYEGQYFIKAGNGFDNGGVHINSGIQNYWFYLLCEGGTGIREKDKVPFYVKAIGWDKATAIAYGTLANYLTPNSEFFDASELSGVVATNLYGAGSEEAKQVQMAWYAVGLADLPASGIKTIRTSETVKISPNPAGSLINISLSSNELKYGMIIDITGKTVLSASVYNGAAIDISAFENGVYMLRFEDGSCIKFVKI